MTNQSVGATVIALKPRIEVNNQGKILSFDLSMAQHYLGRAPEQPPPIGLKVPEDWTVMSRYQATLQKVDNDYYIFDGDGNHPSSNGLFINNKIITPTEGHRLRNGDEVRVSQSPQYWVTITYIDPTSEPAPTSLKQQSVSLKHKSVLLGRDPQANLHLEAPTISRRHATIDTNAQGQYVLTDYSTNGVFVNQDKVNGSMVLPPGAIINIGPYTFVLQNDELVLFDQGDNIRLVAKNLVRVVENKNKQQIRLLNDISLAIEPGQFVALVGGSGSGKSTLMKSLLGVEEVSSGSVHLNGNNLRKYFNIYRNFIGYVPQTDLVHTNLTVREVLYYAAKLRLPPDIDVDEIINRTLQQIELTERQDTLIKSLSGGQLKRASIGVELLADPKLFFLDEPTSGLDPGLDKKMMLLLRRLADEGRTIVLVTHATTNITLCDRIVFLGLGGHLCYFGPPEQANEFFQVTSNDFADIYIKLETREAVQQEAAAYQLSPYKQDYIDPYLNTQENSENPTSPSRVKRSFWQQLTVLIQRYVKQIRRDPVYLFLSLVTAPIGIALVRLVISGDTLTLNGLFNLTTAEQTDRASLARQLLFVITSAAIWAGFASSLQEIVKESAIYLRERLVNLGLFAYLGSKVLTLGGLALIQSLLITVVILIAFAAPQGFNILFLGLPELFQFLPWAIGVFVTTFLTVLGAASLGLMVSAGVKNGTQANSALPILLLPQIIFSGILFNISGLGTYLTWLMISRWSVGAYGSLADINAIIPGAIQQEADNPFKPLKMFDPSLGGITLSWAALVIHILVYLTITFWLQKRKDLYQ